MPEVRPFSPWMYNLSLVDIKDVVAPPYDVVSKEEVEFYKKKSPYNVFHLELPESYEAAKKTLSDWIGRGVLVNSNSRRLFFYETEFRYGGKKFLRRGFIALVEVSPFEEGKVLPHERVFPKVTEDRFNLLKTTKFQFSQIFGIYEDEELLLFNQIDRLKKKLFSVEFNSEVHTLYEISEESYFKKFQEFFEKRPIFIADGHHRYTTALKYKDYMESLVGDSNGRDFSYIAMYLCPIEDENLLMLPTHRVFYETPATFSKLQNFCQEKKVFSFVQLEKLFEEEKNLNGLFEEKSSEFLFLTNEEVKVLKVREEFMESIASKEPELSKVTLYNFLKVLEEATGIKEEELKEKGKVKFLSKEDKVLEEVKKGGVGVIFPVLSPQVLKEVARARKRMPHKCTYFYPKNLTGMLFNEVSGKKLD